MSLADPQGIYGRDDERAELERYVRDERETIVYGLAGIGKSALVEAVRAGLHGYRQCVVDCDRDGTARRVVATLAEGLGALGEDIDAADPVRVHDALMAHLRRLAQPTLIVLDNFETLWEGDPGGAYALLGELAGRPRLSLVIAMRTQVPPQELNDWRRVALDPLDGEAAAELFASRSGLPRGEELEQLVAPLEGNPLAIELAARAVGEGGTAALEQMRRDVDALLRSLPTNVGGARRRSLEASLRLSVRHLDAHGMRLLALLGVLPAGIAASDMAALGEALDHFPDFRRSGRRLAELGLAFENADGRLQTLKPIRDYGSYAHWPSRIDLEVTRRHYLEGVGAGTTTGSAAEHRRALAESPNLTAMAETLPDRVAHCEALIKQGAAELDAGAAAAAREAFRGAAAIARRAREPVLLARAALGLSGGLEGPGHSLDRADEERLSLLREAHAVLDDDEPLKLRVLARLLGELHFDASAPARDEMEKVRAKVRELDARMKRENRLAGDRLQLAVLELATVDPRQDLAERAARIEEAIGMAQALGDVKTEVKARHLLVAVLLEHGEGDAAEAQRGIARQRIAELPRQGDRDAAAWQDGVLERARQLARGEFDEVRRWLAEHPSTGDPADSPYRRWLHQDVVLTLDTGRGAGPPQDSGLDAAIERVTVLTAHLRDAECRKFALSEQDLGTLAYEWWPTWRATHALLLAVRGWRDDADGAHAEIRGLTTLPRRGRDEESSWFGRILRHEYYVQVLALVALTIQRLWVLARAEGASPESPDSCYELRRQWAAELDDRLGAFAGRAVVPGSGVMSLGSVESFRAMAKACTERWSEVGRAFDAAREHNARLRHAPALVRTLVADAESHAFVGSVQGEERAKAAAHEAVDRATALRMEPWRLRAEAVLERCIGR